MLLKLNRIFFMKSGFSDVIRRRLFKVVLIYYTKYLPDHQQVRSVQHRRWRPLWPACQARCAVLTVLGDQPLIFWRHFQENHQCSESGSEKSKGHLMHGHITTQVETMVRGGACSPTRRQIRRNQRKSGHLSLTEDFQKRPMMDSTD